MVDWMVAASLAQTLYWVIHGITVHPRKSRTLPFFITSDLDLAGLKLILAQVMSLSWPWRIPALPRADVVVTVSCRDQHVHSKGEEDH